VKDHEGVLAGFSDLGDKIGAGDLNDTGEGFAAGLRLALKLMESLCTKISEL
jgi:hypothetical protein